MRKLAESCREVLPSRDGKVFACSQGGIQQPSVFRMDENTGKLPKTGKEIVVDTPVCLQLVPVL
jgi:6-phosphogluconolactonase (cycloisomerase 2 family)